jgi:hypothetical protein
MAAWVWAWICACSTPTYPNKVRPRLSYMMNAWRSTVCNVNWFHMYLTSFDCISQWSQGTAVLPSLWPKPSNQAWKDTRSRKVHPFETMKPIIDVKICQGMSRLLRPRLASQPRQLITAQARPLTSFEFEFADDSVSSFSIRWIRHSSEHCSCHLVRSSMHCSTNDGSDGARNGCPMRCLCIDKRHKALAATYWSRAGECTLQLRAQLTCHSLAAYWGLQICNLFNSVFHFVHLRFYCYVTLGSTHYSSYQGRHSGFQKGQQVLCLSQTDVWWLIRPSQYACLEGINRSYK